MSRYPEFEGSGRKASGRYGNGIRQTGTNGDVRGHVQDPSRERDRAYVGNTYEYRGGGSGSREVRASGRKTGHENRRNPIDAQLERAYERGYMEAENRLRAEKSKKSKKKSTSSSSSDSDSDDKKKKKKKKKSSKSKKEDFAKWSAGGLGRDMVPVPVPMAMGMAHEQVMQQQMLMQQQMIAQQQMYAQQQQMMAGQHQHHQPLAAQFPQPILPPPPAVRSFPAQHAIQPQDPSQQFHPGQQGPSQQVVYTPQPPANQFTIVPQENIQIDHNAHRPQDPVPGGYQEGLSIPQQSQQPQQPQHHPPQ